jgi:RNA polymerase sigma factor (TIGR02999 family)
MVPSAPTVTQLLQQARTGDQTAVSKLFPKVYDELRGLAAKHIRRERHQSLQATALVHEAYLRLIPNPNLQWQDRAHFLAIAARSMRQVLIERARARGSKKRGGKVHPVTLTDAILAEAQRPIDLVALDEALNRLGELDPKQAELVELRFFGGLTVEETAEVMGISPATVKRLWVFSKSWLRRELQS